MRSFLTRLVSSVTRSLLLAACLLICLACATPFPLDSLEVDMTMVQATEAFGEPSSTEMGELHEAVQLLQKENARILERLESAVDQSETRGPAARKLERSSTQVLGSLEGFVAELDEAPGEGVASTWVYPHEEVVAWRVVALIPLSIPWLGFPFLLDMHIKKLEVELVFDGNKLVSWETRPAPSVPTTGTSVYWSPPMTFPTHSSKDTQHHQKGHKHHH